MVEAVIAGDTSDRIPHGDPLPGSALGAQLIWAAAGRARTRMEPPAVPSHHPRVYVRADQVDELRERVQSTEFAATWDRVRDAADSTFCDAFVYLITGDADRGRAAIDRTVDRFERGDTTPAHGPHHFDHDLHAGACAYDWCYDLMTDAEKERLVGAFADYCREHAPGYPAGSLTTNTVVGHA